MRTGLSLAVLFATLPAAAIDVDGNLRILNRFNYQRDAVQTLLLFDEQAQRFRVEDYLLPSLEQIFSTHVVAGLLDVNLGGGWSFTLSADSGVLRVGSEPRVEDVPFVVGRRRVSYPIPTTRTEVVLRANGLPLSDEAERSFFLREAYFSYGGSGGVRITAGKRRVVLADGFLYDQFTFGAGFQLGGVERGWRLNFDALVADGSFDAGGKSSPILHLGVHYIPGPLQHLGLSLVYLHDGDSLLSEVFRTSITEASIEASNRLPGLARTPLFAVQVPLDSSGDVLWFGLSGKRFLGDHTVGGLLFGQFGQARVRSLLPVRGTPTLIDVDLRAVGMLADLYYQYDLTEDLVLGGFFTVLTGDDDLAEGFRQRGGSLGTTSTFLSIFPFVTRANLFFNGGLNAEFTLRKAATVGVNARGVVAGGAFARWETPRLTLEGRAIALGAHRPSIYDGRYYGTEIDLGLRVPLARQVTFVAEADALFTGSFFARQRTFTQLIVGIDASLP